MEIHSSTHGGGEPFFEIEKDHRNVVKPDGPDHPSYKALREAYHAAFAGSRWRGRTADGLRLGLHVHAKTERSVIA